MSSVINFDVHGQWFECRCQKPLILRKIIAYVRATVVHITCISPDLSRPIIIIDLYISVSRRRIPIAYIHRVCLLSYYMHRGDCLLSYFMHRGDYLLVYLQCWARKKWNVHGH